MNLVPIDDPVLNTPAKPIEDFDAVLIEQFNQMFTTLNETEYGDRLGMAFPQIGIALRGIIVQGLPMVNPEWRGAQQFEPTTEGCYSLPQGQLYKRTRNKYGWAKWQDPETGAVVEKKLTGLTAIIFQHELDHLNGLLCNR